MRSWVNFVARASGYILPRKITRILVGPDASKDKLKNSLGELQKISGLSGVVMGYTPN